MKKKTNGKAKRDDSFESVAKRLGCDTDLKKFDDQLRKVAKKPAPKSRKSLPL